MEPKFKIGELVVVEAKTFTHLNGVVAPVVGIFTAREVERDFRRQFLAKGIRWVAGCRSPLLYKIEGIDSIGWCPEIDDRGYIGEPALRKYYPPTGKSVQEFMATLQGIPA